jgi:hypothetical protein
MKIIVNGSIIDTINIYKITPIEGNFAAFYSDGIRYTGFSFLIVSFNKEVIKVYLGGESIFKNSDWWHSDIGSNTIIPVSTELYLERSEIIKNKLDIFRTKIIDIWTENQTNLPQFNLSDEL